MKSKFYIFIKAVLGPIARLIFNVRFHGAENEPTAEEGPYVLICNHISNPDPVFLCLGLKNQQPCYMAKKELFKVPLLGSLVKALGAYPVNRGGADVGVIRRTIDMLKQGVCVGMFPQGHRYKKVDPRTTPIKNGAAMIALKAGVQVLPVFVKVKNNKHFFLCKKEVIVGKPISIEEMNYDPEAPGEYQRIAELLFERVCELGD